MRGQEAGAGDRQHGHVAAQLARVQQGQGAAGQDEKAGRHQPWLVALERGQGFRVACAGLAEGDRSADHDGRAQHAQQAGGQHALAARCRFQV